MKYLVFALALLGATPRPRTPRTAIPDLKGTWSGKGKINRVRQPCSSSREPDPQRPAARARHRRDTYVVEGQDGRLVWGRSASAVADTKEPFAWAISSDNKTIVGADMDGLLPDHPRLTRPDGQVLRPQRRRRRKIGGRHLLHDGSKALIRSSRSRRAVAWARLPVGDRACFSHGAHSPAAAARAAGSPLGGTPISPTNTDR